ncbi:hypothetical protein PQR75_06535 [Paraburkholderia fungorum]|uniref:hypothetical protein n=1 Tax=Paraburkholderia fungorum TaxID=134537 RepID=UPI0038BC9129
MTHDEIEQLNRMSPSELAAYKRQQTARIDAEQIQRFGYAVSAQNEGRKVDMTHYRADSAQPTMKAVVHVDQTGRRITEFRGTSMREWMGQFMTPGYRQLGVYNGCTPKQEMDFRRDMQRKLAALAGSR